ncbi:acyl-CoA mutase large subunit family protein [Caldinitratiruptor microaerophilus]|uniref:methylmalonyl-CoA mutase n=1 Tax=Caldinitratiruptor microaerophilus TaxID=671077 RepID=A0AA35CHX7_9FIRM|nr:methylmalonyl-CoA mutase family protein [Caldinitratiruptor microaerophilus]BDG59242.1 methylmalonyl-CoA mutase [Caldinitratiruptor microaerophilus]
MAEKHDGPGGAGRDTGEWAERKLRFAGVSDREVKRVYRPEDIAGLDYARDLGDPGEYPFTRGVYPTMYRGRLWTMRQFAGFGTAEETNARFKYLLQTGQTGLSIAFDMPTLLGYDSDHPFANGEVGKLGVAIDSLRDFEILMDGIPLDKVSTSMTINPPASIMLAMYLVVAEQQGVGWDQVSGTIQNDILKDYIAQKTYIYPPEPSVRLIVDTIEFCTRHVPKWNTISISGYHIREAGATAAQELAFTLADGMYYVEAAMARGLDVDEFAPRLSFFFDVHNDFFEEIAKFRAARRLWARIMREKYGAKNPRSWMLRTHAQTAGVSLTAQQPENNIVRVAIQALAAVLGGTQSLHTNSYDEALALPTEEAVRIALRTQQIIAEETGVANTIDPLAGSYYVESLTNQLEEEAQAYFRKIEALGGVVKAIEKGFFQREIADSAYRFQRRLKSGDYVVVGVNKYADPNEKVRTKILKINPEVQRRQIERVREVRARRDPARAQKALAELRKASQSSENLMPYILECVRAYCTEGEIAGVWREVWGEWREEAIY